MFRQFGVMSDCRRARVPGGSYFFTVNLALRGGSLLTDHVEDLRSACVATVLEHPLTCDAMVVLPALRRKGEAGIWQRRFWEHCIRDEADFRAHVEYCWISPVKHGLVGRAVDWPFSSIHRDLREGRAGKDWA